MDIANWGNKAKIWIFKFRYPILVLLVGLVLITIPSKIENKAAPLTEAVAPTQASADVAQQLTQILQQIKGVGKVKVLLTVSKGEKTEYQQDEDQSVSENESSIRKETIIIRDADDNEMALITQVIPPEYLGAIVVCEGADDANVKLAVLEAVSKATGLRSDKISVLKMK